MAIITIHLNVLNPKEVIESNKSSFFADIADFFLSDEALKTKVEDAMVKEIMDKLKESLNKELSEKGVEFILDVIRTDK